MRSVRHEPQFDERPLRRPRREHPIDDNPRMVKVGRRGGKSMREPGRMAVAGRWLLRYAIKAPMTAATALFLLVAVFAGLISGGHMSFGGSGDTGGAMKMAAVSAAPDGGSTAWFPISDIVATGQSRTNRVELLKAIAFKPGDDMLDASPSDIRVHVEALDWVDTAKVSRLWPSTIQVQITEKEPFAIWQSKGVLWLVDDKGRKITTDGIADFASLPMVVGEGAPEHAPALFDTLKRFPVVGRLVKASVRVGDRRWDLHLKNGVEVSLPEPTPDYSVDDALQRLTTLEQEQKILERDIEAVDLRLPDRLIVKPRGGAPGPAAKGQST